MTKQSSLRIGRALLAALALGFAATSAAWAADGTRYYVNDHLATTVGIADAAGEIAALEADAFGSPLAGGANAGRFTGKPYDEDLGAYVFPFRNYRADEARWMSADPSGFPDGVNGRIYAPNPIHGLDPFGLAVERRRFDFTQTWEKLVKEDRYRVVIEYSVTNSEDQGVSSGEGLELRLGLGTAEGAINSYAGISSGTGYSYTFTLGWDVDPSDAVKSGTPAGLFLFPQTEVGGFAFESIIQSPSDVLISNPAFSSWVNVGSNTHQYRDKVQVYSWVASAWYTRNVE